MTELGTPADGGLGERSVARSDRRVGRLFEVPAVSTRGERVTDPKLSDSSCQRDQF